MAEMRWGSGPDQAITTAATLIRERPSSSAGPTTLLEAGFLASMTGLALLTAELRYELVNEYFRALCPAPGAVAPGGSFEEAGPLTAQPLPALAREALTSGGEFRGETEVIDGRGRHRWLDFLVRRVSGETEVGVLVELHDRTAPVQVRQGMEAAAAAAGRRAADLEDVLATVPHGIMVFDAGGRLVRMNAAATETWRAAGVNPAASGRPDFSTLDVRGEDGRPVPPGQWPLPRALAGERVRGMQLRVTPEGARPVWMLASASPLLDGAGRVVGAVLSFSDESALHEQTEARDDLIRMVSHDLRTPLSSIYAQAHLLRRTAEPSSQIAERAASIERSCGRMSGMIQDLVEVTLLEAGQLPVSVSAVDLSALIPDILDGLRGALPVDRVRLRLDPCCRANLDPARLERVVVNLVSNALKYSADQIELSLQSGGGVVTLSVRDKGVGISAEDQARVFERYYRARGERRPEGLGLGLYITRLLVEGMGGRIELESRLGQGSTFRVLFQAVEA